MLFELYVKRYDNFYNYNLLKRQILLIKILEYYSTYLLGSINLLHFRK